MMDSDPLSKPVRQKALYRFAWFAAALVALLIFFGGHVKSTNSGLSVPDWPNTYGHFMFAFPLDQMIGGIFWEHSHRMIASVVGLLTFALTIWVWRVDNRTWVKRLALGASFAVLAQGIMGGLTVLNFLPAWASSTHGTLAQLYFCLMIWLALSLSPSWNADRNRYADGGSFPIRRLAFLTVGAIGVQLILGAIMRHTESGLVIPDFPMMFGSWSLPLSDASLAHANAELARNGLLSKMRLTEVTQGQMLIHLAHRFWAVVVSTFAVWTAVRIFRGGMPSQLRRPAALMMVLLTVQVTLGILTIYTERQPSITTFHVLTGALTLGTAFALAVRARRLLYRPEQKSERYLTVDPITLDSKERERSESHEVAA